jgi:hypothetical protein
LAIYCLWHGISALRTGSVASPTMLSPGTTEKQASPVSYWIQVLFWLLAAGAIGFKVATWCYATMAA